ncbi:MAG: ATP-binding protein [Clostridia bacterium]|nr:ATP-binding protein [Clostridia bacterium]
MSRSESLERVKERFDEKRKRRDEEATMRREAAERREPRLRAVGIRMRSIGPRVLEESMRGGPDLKERLGRIHEENRALQAEYGDILEEMGLPRDHTKPHRDCKLCDDTGFVGGKLCACFKREVVLDRYRASGIGKLLQSQTFDSFDLSWYPTRLLPDARYSARDVMAQILADCKAYAAAFTPDSPSLLFIGGTGLGKTHLSSAIAGEVIRKGYDVVYESVPRVVSLFQKERFTEGEEIDRLFEAELLILDDLGTESGGKTTVSDLYHLINERASVRRLPTIISTNLSYRQLEKQYDTAILSRLLGEFEVKLFHGDDIRLAKLNG